MLDHRDVLRANRASLDLRDVLRTNRASLDHRDVLPTSRASLARGVDKPRAPRAAREVTARDNDAVNGLVHADLAGAYISFVPPPWRGFCSCWEASPPHPSMMHTTTFHKTRPTSSSDVAQSPYSGSSRGASLKKRFLGLPAGAELELRGRARVRLGQPQPPCLLQPPHSHRHALPLGNQIHQKSKYRQIGNRIVAGPSVP